MLTGLAELAAELTAVLTGLAELAGVRAARRRRARRRSSSKRSNSSKAMFFLLLFVVPVSGAAYWGIGQFRAKQIREANAALIEATKLVKSDTFKGYEEAITKAQFALDLDANADTTRSARGLLAYSYTIRWGEHLHEESIRESAE